MRRLLLVGAMIALLGARVVSANVTRDNFLDNTTQDLVTLCTAADDDPLRLAAIGFCHGYVVGVWHFHEQLARGKKHQRIAAGKRDHCLLLRDRGALIVARTLQSRKSVFGL